MLHTRARIPTSLAVYLPLTLAIESVGVDTTAKLALYVEAFALTRGLCQSPELFPSFRRAIVKQQISIASRSFQPD
ncbi:hypothetical protein IE81DRAFT_320790 [Ceraceosorus guamensis]|uniref:Secreted protein n=1 Tax=Ceraceosorus guamensis TaxID=1522189 RepID=A0A316WB22_9BASI|nr:hypothetical protein IE81DRAFT_320790 [Ceraceosorus guamensis]PWN44825.1 hypothetical protein IE81DRAFT_320790 [Ceraceosorus guamensis]